MAKINIDDVEYDFDTLPEAAKGQVQSLQFVEVELQRLEAQIAVYKTARGAYIAALKNALPQQGDKAVSI